VLGSMAAAVAAASHILESNRTVAAVADRNISSSDRWGRIVSCSLYSEFERSQHLLIVTRIAVARIWVWVVLHHDLTN